MRQQRAYYGRSSAGSPGNLGHPSAGNASAQPIVLTLQPPAHSQAPQPPRTGISLQGLVPQSSGGLLDILNDSDDEVDSNDSASGSSNSSGLPSPYVGCIDDVGNTPKSYKIYTRSGTSPSRGGSFYSGRWNVSTSTSRGANAPVSYSNSNVSNDRTPKRMKSIDLDRSLDENPLIRSTSVPIGVSRSGLLTPRNHEMGLNQLSLNSSSSDESDDCESGSSCNSSSCSSSSSYKQKIRLFANDDDDNSGGSSVDRSSINTSGSNYSNSTSGINNSGVMYFKKAHNWDTDNTQGERENERRRSGDNAKFTDDVTNGLGKNVLEREEDPSQGLWDDQEWAMRMCGNESDIEAQVRNFRVLENSCVGSHMKDISTCFDTKRLLSEEEIQVLIRQQYAFAAVINSASKEARTFLELTGDRLFTENESVAKTLKLSPVCTSSSSKTPHDEKINLCDSSNNYDDFNDDDYLSPDEQ